MDGMRIMTGVLKEFGGTIGSPEMAPDEDGYASFSVDEDLIIHLQYERELETLRFFASLGEVPAVDRASVVDDLLDANVLWRGTGGATLGLDSTTNFVTMAYQEPVNNIDLTRFEQILEGFIVTAEEWMRRVRGEAPAEPATREPDDMRGSIRV